MSPEVGKQADSQPQSVAAVWFPDPRATGQLRYWDGAAWTDQVAPIPDPAAASATRTPRPIRRRIGWAALASFLLALLVVGYAMWRGQDIKRVSTSGEIEFYSTGDRLSEGEIEAQQGGLEQRVSELENAARTQAGTSAPAPGEADLSGSWTGENGLGYSIQQFGSQVVIQETSPYGITAAGQGVIQGSDLFFDYQAADGSFGSGTFKLEGADTLRGTFDNHTYLISTPAVLHRA